MLRVQARLQASLGSSRAQGTTNQYRAIAMKEAPDVTPQSILRNPQLQTEFGVGDQGQT